MVLSCLLYPTSMYATIKVIKTAKSAGKYSFDYERWRSRSFLEQMANIAAEVGRTFSAKRRGDEEAMTGALYRGLDLIDATAEILAEQKSPRLRELLRAREIFAGLEDESIEDYFMQYALTLRKDR